MPARILGESVFIDHRRNRKGMRGSLDPAASRPAAVHANAGKEADWLQCNYSLLRRILPVVDPWNELA